MSAINGTSDEPFGGRYYGISNSKCDTLYNGAILQPHLWMPVSTIILMIIKYSFQWIASCFRKLSEHNRTSDDDTTSRDESLSSVPQIIDDENLVTPTSIIIDRDIEMGDDALHSGDIELVELGGIKTEACTDVILSTTISTTIDITPALASIDHYSEYYEEEENDKNDDHTNDNVDNVGDDDDEDEDDDDDEVPLPPAYYDSDIDDTVKAKLEEHDISENDYRKWINIFVNVPTLTGLDANPVYGVYGMTMDHKLEKIKKSIEKYNEAEQIKINAKMKMLFMDALTRKIDEVPFLIFQFIFAVVAIILSIIDVDKTLSPWVIYTNIYGVLVNSCFLTPLISCVIPYYDFKNDIVIGDGDAEKKWLLDIPEDNIDHIKLNICISLMLVALPILCTHFIPGLVFYGWFLFIVVPLGFIFLISNDIGFLIASFVIFFVRTVFLQLGCEMCGVQISDTFSGHLVLEFVVRLYFTFALQATINCMTIIYSQPYPLTTDMYVKAAVTELLLRAQCSCFVTHSVSSIKNGLIFYNWL